MELLDTLEYHLNKLEAMVDDELDAIETYVSK
jgi:hypothetical protein